TATDGASHTAECHRTVTVVDQTPPVITLGSGSPSVAPPDTLVSTSPVVVSDTDCSGSASVALPQPSATDNCDGTRTVTSDAPATYLAGQTRTVTYTATDLSLNVGHATQTVNVRYGANVQVNAQKHTVGSGPHPTTTVTPLAGVTLKAFDTSPGS